MHLIASIAVSRQVKLILEPLPKITGPERLVSHVTNLLVVVKIIYSPNIIIHPSGKIRLSLDHLKAA
jgi:hypothetical protein